MKVVVDPLLIVCALDGEIVPFEPALGVTVKLLSVNVAVTPEVAVMLNVQLPVPEQLVAEPVPPDQPVHVEPVSAVPDRVIDVPELAVHVPVLPDQLKVQPVALTVPVPVPDLVTVRVTACQLR